MMFSRRLREMTLHSLDFVIAKEQLKWSLLGFQWAKLSDLGQWRWSLAGSGSLERHHWVSKEQSSILITIVILYLYFGWNWSEKCELFQKTLTMTDCEALVGHNLIPDKSSCCYTSCYCEENVYKLLEGVRETAPGKLGSMSAVFISNSEQCVPLW